MAAARYEREKEEYSKDAALCSRTFFDRRRAFLAWDPFCFLCSSSPTMETLWTRITSSMYERDASSIDPPQSELPQMLFSGSLTRAARTARTSRVLLIEEEIILMEFLFFNV